MRLLGRLRVILGRALRITRGKRIEVLGLLGRTCISGDGQDIARIENAGRTGVDALLERARDLVIVHGERGHLLADFLGLLEGVERTRDATLCHVGLT